MRGRAIFRISFMPRLLWGRLILVSFCLLLPWAPTSFAADAGEGVAVFVSRDIRPYIAAAEGISEVLSESADVSVEVFSLEKIKGKSRDLLLERAEKDDFALFIAIGPEAVRLISEKIAPGGAPWLYSMILNPPGVSEAAAGACGVSLDIPAEKQLEMIGLGLPSVKRLGLLYDPRYNEAFFADASDQAGTRHLDIVPLPISSKKDIPAVLKQHWENIDALWLIPDQTVISESIVQYIIKEALFRDAPVIGYNRFFYESGAALAFVFDYAEIGRQTGRMAVRVLNGDACEKALPVFQVWRNLRVINKLGISLPENSTPPIKAGP